MIDLHCHILPGIDDGARSLDIALAIARAQVADGVGIVACTPHIMPGVYWNSGPQICAAVQSLQQTLDTVGIPLRLVDGADNHVVPDQIARLRSGDMLTLAGTRYVLIEPPHNVAPARLDEHFFGLMVAGFVPILTHPERLGWIKTHYGMIQRMADRGVWMQITAGSLAGHFGKSPKYWAERMLEEGRVHILATDAHDPERRRPILSIGRDIAAKRVGPEEAHLLVMGRPQAILHNAEPSRVPMPPAQPGRGGHGGHPGAPPGPVASLAGRLRRLFG